MAISERDVEHVSERLRSGVVPESRLPKPTLEPLLVLEGSVPEGWKDGIYGMPGTAERQEGNETGGPRARNGRIVRNGRNARNGE